MASNEKKDSHNKQPSSNVAKDKQRMQTDSFGTKAKKDDVSKKDNPSQRKTSGY